MQKGLIVTLDGPAGAGKSSVSRKLSNLLGYTYIDTGAMYRAIALYFKQQGIPWENHEQIEQDLSGIQLEFRSVNGENHIFLNGVDSESAIRQREISRGASVVSAIPAVRDFLLEQQRALGENGGVVLEGRDIGTVVFPNAELKFYLDASSEQRARRRLLQTGGGSDADFEQLKKEIEARDLADMRREIAPLRCPEDAITVDSSELSLDEVIDLMYTHFENRNKVLNQ